MRRLLMISVLLTVFCPVAEAAWPMGRKKAAQAEAQTRAAIQALAPTEAESVAIKRLREKSLIQSRNDGIIRQDPVIFQRNPNDSQLQPLPAEAAPIPPGGDEQIGVEIRFIAMKEPFAQSLIAEKSLTWTGLPILDFETQPISVQVPIAQQDGSVQYATQMVRKPVAKSQPVRPGFHATVSETAMPLQVRYMEQTTARKLLDLVQGTPNANVLQSPKVTIFSGQMATVADSSQHPYVSSVIPVEQDGETAYQPVIYILDEGLNMTVQGTLLQDRSCRLDGLNVTQTKVTKVDTYRLVDGDPDQFEKVTAKDKQKSGVTIQCPMTARFEANLPSIVIPEGMSLLVAMPGGGYFNGDQVLLLVTPQRIVPEEIDQAQALGRPLR